MKIYSKVGDYGETSLIGGKKILKSDIRLNLIGGIDELSSTLGLALSFFKKKNNISIIRRI